MQILQNLSCFPLIINVNKKKVVPDFIFFTAQRSENIFHYFVYNKYMEVKIPDASKERRVEKQIRTA